MSYASRKSKPIKRQTKPINQPTILNRPLRIININFQSCKTKTQELQHLIHSIKPDVIIGTETWLHSEISSNKIFKPDMGYNVYRKDRSNQAYGGVLLAISKKLNSCECPGLDTDCELLWVKIDMVGDLESRPFILGPFIDHPIQTNLY